MFILIVLFCSTIVFASRNVSVVKNPTKPVTKISLNRISEEEGSLASAVKILKIDRGPSFVASKHPKTKDYGDSHYYRIKEPDKPMSMLSMLKGALSKGISNDSPSQYHAVEDHDGGGGGWGVGDDHHHYHHKHVYTIKGGGTSTYFSFLDIVLTGLSLISFGAFLLNLLMNLLALGGFLTTTGTGTLVPTLTSTTTGTSTGGTGTATGGTSTGTATATGGTATATGGTITGGVTGGVTAGGGVGVTAGGGAGVASALSTFTSPFKNNWFKKRLRKKKKRKGRGKIKASAGFSGTKGKRQRRSSCWEPYVDPYTSLDIASRSILNSIEAVTNQYECVERIFCDSNRHAGIVGRGLEYFMPIYSFTVSYFGRKLGLHEKLPDHLSAIILGVQESNCQSNFPQCESQR